INQILVDGETWQLVGDGYARVDGPAVNPKGEVFFSDTKANKIFAIGPDGSAHRVSAEQFGAEAFDSQGRRYAIERSDPKNIVCDGQKLMALGLIAPNDLVVAHNGNLYITDDPAKGSDAPSKVWLITPDGKQQVVDTGLKFANGVTLSPDQTLLYVS